MVTIVNDKDIYVGNRAVYSHDSGVLKQKMQFIITEKNSENNQMQ